jgi:hypothetical protein
MAALLKTFRSTDFDRIELLSGGLSGSGVYKMIVHNRAYVLKLDLPSEHSSPALMQASEAGIAPRVCYRDSSSGITITDFIEAVPLRTALTPEKLVPELARTIRSIHDLACPIAGPDLRQTIGGMTKDFLQVAARNKPPGHPLNQEMEGNTLKAFGEGMAAGKLSMATYEGQLMYGKAQMNEAIRQMRSPRFEQALKRL